MNIAYSNCRIFTGETFLEGKGVLVKGNRIEAIVPCKEIPAHYTTRDLNGLTLCPGFIDLQLYGGGSPLFASQPSLTTLEQMYHWNLRQGTTHFLATLPTVPAVTLHQAFRAASSFKTRHGDGLVGLHLEGPFLNKQKRGAHLEEYIQTPSPELVTQLLTQAQGTIALMTLAPEQCSQEIIDLMLKHKMVLSAGHSNATYRQAMAAFSQGFSALTHLWNGMSSFTSREPGLVGAAFDAPTVQASIVVDGIHCDFATVRISKKLLAERLFLITDATVPTHHGPYQFYQQQDHFTNENGMLSGSALTMMQAISNCVNKVGIPLAEALRMASLYPARVLGLHTHLGLIRVGYQASFCFFDNTFVVHGTFTNGSETWNLHG